MKPLFLWVRNNVALSFFFTAEISSLLFGFLLLAGSYREDSKKTSSTQPPPMLVITEEAYYDLIALELEEFAHLPVPEPKILVASREQAIKEFEKNEYAILILSKRLNNEELKALKMKPGRLPIHQDMIDHSTVSDSNLPVFIRDNIISKVENRLAAFLIDNQIQDVVFQKFYQRSPKSSFREG